MRIRVLSDLHLEFEREVPSTASAADSPLFTQGGLPAADADVVVLAGDIGLGADGVLWARDTFACPVVFVAGNHEFYGERVDRAYQSMRAEAAGSTVNVLENEGVVVEAGRERVRFLGCTLWTDFGLYPESIEYAMWAAERGMNDYHRIAVAGANGVTDRLRPSHTRDFHRESVAWLARELSQPFEGRTVVVTHMLPSASSIGARYQGSPLNAAFASDLDALIERHAPALWIHGHTHDSFDYRLGETRVVCNPRGYFPDELNPRFDPLAIFEL